MLVEPGDRGVRSVRLTPVGVLHPMPPVPDVAAIDRAARLDEHQRAGEELIRQRARIVRGIGRNLRERAVARRARRTGRSARSSPGTGPSRTRRPSTRCDRPFFRIVLVRSHADVPPGIHTMSGNGGAAAHVPRSCTHLEGHQVVPFMLTAPGRRVHWPKVLYARAQILMSLGSGMCDALSAPCRTMNRAFSAFVEHGPFFAFVKDAQARYLYINPAMERAFGVALRHPARHRGRRLAAGATGAGRARARPARAPDGRDRGHRRGRAAARWHHASLDDRQVSVPPARRQPRHRRHRAGRHRSAERAAAAGRERAALPPSRRERAGPHLHPRHGRLAADRESGRADLDRPRRPTP